MLTAEENEMLTRVGPGTPSGELLRRYWHPVAIAGELSEDNPVKFVRILCEDLVLFQPKREKWVSCMIAVRIAARLYLMAESSSGALPVPIMVGSTIFRVIVLKPQPSRRRAIFVGL